MKLRPVGFRDTITYINRRVPDDFLVPKPVLRLDNVKTILWVEAKKNAADSDVAPRTC